MALLKDASEGEHDHVRLSTPTTVLDAFGEFVAAIRDYTESVRSGDAPSDDIQRKMERAFDQITALSAHLYHLRALNRESVRAREEERKRVSREIHDGPAQTVAALVRRIEICQRLAERGEIGELTAAHKDAKMELQGAVAELRRIMSDLRPTELDNLSFSGAIESIVGRVTEGRGVSAHVRVEEELGLKRDEQTFLFRIIQECVRNVVKHASASKLKVAIRKSQVVGEVTEIEAVVEDDGVGISKDLSIDQLMEAKKFGLISMRERAEVLGGRLVFSKSDMGGLRMRLLIRQRRDE